MSFVHTPGHTGPEKNVLKGNLGMGIIFICDLQMKTLLAASFMKTKAVTGPEKVFRLKFNDYFKGKIRDGHLLVL